MASTSTSRAKARPRGVDAGRRPRVRKARHEAELARNFAALEAMMPELETVRHGQNALMRHGKIVRFFVSPAKAYAFALKAFPDHLFSIQPIPAIELFEIHGVPR